MKLYAVERSLYNSSCKGYKDRDLRNAAANRGFESIAIPGIWTERSFVKLKKLTKFLLSVKTLGNLIPNTVFSVLPILSSCE